MTTKIKITNMECKEKNIIVELPFQEDIEDILKKIDIDSFDPYTIELLETEIDELYEKVNENTDLEILNEFIDKLENEFTSEEQHTIFAIMIVSSNNDISDDLYIFDQNEYHYYDKMTLKEVAEELINEGLYGEIPENIRRYIDYTAIGEDLGNDGYEEIESTDMHGKDFYGTIVLN